MDNGSGLDILVFELGDGQPSKTSSDQYCVHNWTDTKWDDALLDHPALSICEMSYFKYHVLQRTLCFE